ncbi:MAG: CHAT domain-containing protein, partial [Planctomycetota bacterium]|nr:CHAT domain-containing protein [Planctomycetota bacterium]
ETGRAGGLLEALGGRAQLRSAAIPEGLREEEALVRKAMDTARARHQEAVQVKDLKQARSRKKELDVAQEKMRDVIQKIQRDAKASAGLLYPSPVALAELQGTLAKDEVLVSYAVFSRKAMALVITAGTARVVQLGEREAIVDACDALVLDDTEEDPSGRIEQLRELLIKPLALEAGVKRILISPDGPLSYIPFSMLVGTRAVAYVPSGTTLALLRGERHERGKKVLALGDPVYTGELERLPETRTEAKAVGDVVLLGEDATKAGLETALAKRKRWRAVHLACHGLIDRERPTLSSLAITGGNLTAFDVMRMNFAADLVVLSACETGKGKIVRGEGLIGLTRAFMLAGTPRVIVSLWPVEDKATQALMKKFFQLWKRGAPAASALMKAQAHVRSKKKWKHPSYWAAWQLWGLPE